jgi:hypothetical protein
VLISSCSINPSFVFGIVYIPTDSALVFNDAVITFQARGIRVDGGFLIVCLSCVSTFIL